MLDKEGLEELYAKMSIGQMAEHLKIPRSTLYYQMRKLGITRRSKSDAQKLHLEENDHQRLGRKHKDETKEKISDARRAYWDSDKGKKQKETLAELRRKEWQRSSGEHKNAFLARLRNASRPGPGELSNFGAKLVEFLSEHEEVQTGMSLTRDHVSDIILVNRRVVIELLLPVSVYGELEQRRIEERYDRLTAQLNAAGYRVVIIEDRSNSVSTARCKRVYEQLTSFFESKEQKITIQS